MKTYSAPFITIEGVDGAGKSSHMDTILGALRDAGFEVVSTREPGGTEELGAVLREQLKTREMDSLTAALIAFADRNEHLAQKIRPALRAGKAVLSDRFTDSTFAYQGGGDGCDVGKMQALERMVHADCQPDLTLFFDLPTEVAEARRERRKQVSGNDAPDKFDEKSLKWFAEVRNAYLKRIEESPSRYITIDGSGTLEEVAALVKSALTDYLDRWPSVAARRATAAPVLDRFVKLSAPDTAQTQEAFVAFLQCQDVPLSMGQAVDEFLAIRQSQGQPYVPSLRIDLKLAALAAIDEGRLEMDNPNWTIGPPARTRAARP